MRQENERPVLGYTVKDTARVLQIGLNQAYAAIKDGRIPSLKIGKRIIGPGDLPIFTLPTMRANIQTCTREG